MRSSLFAPIQPAKAGQASKSFSCATDTVDCRPPLALSAEEPLRGKDVHDRLHLSGDIDLPGTATGGLAFEPDNEQSLEYIRKPVKGIRPDLLRDLFFNYFHVIPDGTVQTAEGVVAGLSEFVIPSLIEEPLQDKCEERQVAGI
jgi:hypothetical protein